MPLAIANASCYTPKTGRQIARKKPGHSIMELLKLKSAIEATSIGKSEGATLYDYPTAMETINRSIFFLKGILT